MPEAWVRLGWKAPANQDGNCSMLLSRVERNDLISSARYQEKCPSNLFPEPEAVSLQGWSWWVGVGRGCFSFEALRAGLEMV